MNTDNTTEIEGAEFGDRLVGLSSEGGILYEIFDFLEPLGRLIDGLLNILSAVTFVQ